MLPTKEHLISKSLELVQERIDALEKELKNLNDAAASDTKSSMGDKYETSREMINLEKAKLSEQLKLAQMMRSGLANIDAKRVHQTATLGAVVSTDSGHYFLSVALGQLEVQGQTVFAISMTSPLAQQMMKKCKGDFFQLAGRNHRILDIF